MVEFNSANIDLAGINKYLKTNGVQLSETERQVLNTIFDACDTYDENTKAEGKDGKLKGNEWKNFIAQAKEKLPNLLKTLQNYKFKEEADAVMKTIIEKTAPADATRVNKNIIINTKDLQTNKTNQSNTTNLILQEVRKYKGVVKESDVDCEHWAQIIDKVAEKYNVPQEILVSIIGKETNGTFKSVNSKNGSGPMQITTISVNAFFPNAKGNWHDIFKSMDSDLLNDILYEKDANGNPTNKLKYNSPKELRNACAKDDELGVMVGLLTFEMKYTQAVAAKKFKGSSWKTTPMAAEELKKGNPDFLSEGEIKECVRTALVNYNGTSLKNLYATNVVDSLANMKFDYETFNPLKE